MPALLGKSRNTPGPRSFNKLPRIARSPFRRDGSDISRDVFDVNQGSLYPALQAMVRRGWLRAEWRASENNRRARVYKLTAAGRRRLEAETASWEQFALSIKRILQSG